VNISPVSPQSVTNANVNANRRSAGGAADSVQAASVLPSPVSSTTDTSKTAASNGTPSQDQVTQAVKQVNDAFTQKGLNLYASFEKDKITGIDIVKIKEKKSDEVIRQFPPQETVAFAQSLDLPEGWRGQWIRNMT
jgi:uncharacterized FlaG/YvyC family protein